MSSPSQNNPNKKEKQLKHTPNTKPFRVASKDLPYQHLIDKELRIAGKSWIGRRVKCFWKKQKNSTSRGFYEGTIIDCALHNGTVEYEVKYVDKKDKTRCWQFWESVDNGFKFVNTEATWALQLDIVLSIKKQIGSYLAVPLWNDLPENTIITEQGAPINNVNNIEGGQPEKVEKGKPQEGKPEKDESAKENRKGKKKISEFVKSLYDESTSSSNSEEESFSFGSFGEEDECFHGQADGKNFDTITISDESSISEEELEKGKFCWRILPLVVVVVVSVVDVDLEDVVLPLVVVVVVSVVDVDLEDVV